MSIVSICLKTHLLHTAKPTAAEDYIDSGQYNCNGEKNNDEEY